MRPGLVVYVDTSALVALLVEHAYSEALVDWLDLTAADLVSSDLLETELRRMAVREGLDQTDVSLVLEGVNLAGLDRAAFRSAGLLPMPGLRSLDALHLESAIRLNADAILTYDLRLAEAAGTLGLEVVSPNRQP